MGLSEALDNASYYFSHLPVSKALASTIAEFTTGAYRRVHPYLPNRGVNVYDRGWDVLVVLDTCRVDALQTVAPEYDFIPNEVPAVRSVGSKTRQWMQHTFSPEHAEEMRRTAYVTYNPNSHEELHAADFLLLKEVWRTDWDIEQGGVPPRPVTDYALSVARTLDPDRLIVHYKQPHQPYALFEKLDSTEHIDDTANDRSGVFGAIIEGKVTREEAWDAYLDELRWALDDVELLLSAMDAETVVITADHGECFGEWGLYGHPGSVPVPELVRVPWVVTSAERHTDYEPSVELDAVGDDGDVDEKLRALGYKV